MLVPTRKSWPVAKKAVYEIRLVSMGRLDLMVRALNRLRYSVASAAVR
jgi:hypothetical protein